MQYRGLFSVSIMQSTVTRTLMADRRPPDTIVRPGRAGFEIQSRKIIAKSSGWKLRLALNQRVDRRI